MTDAQRSVAPSPCRKFLLHLDDEEEYRQAKVVFADAQLREAVLLGRYERCSFSEWLGKDELVSRVHALLVERQGRSSWRRTEAPRTWFLSLLFGFATISVVGRATRWEPSARIYRDAGVAGCRATLLDAVEPWRARHEQWVAESALGDVHADEEGLIVDALAPEHAAVHHRRPPSEAVDQEQVADALEPALFASRQALYADGLGARIEVGATGLLARTEPSAKARFAQPNATTRHLGMTIGDLDTRGLVVTRHFGAVHTLNVPVLEAPLEGGTVAPGLDAIRNACVLRNWACVGWRRRGTTTEQYRP